MLQTEGYIQALLANQQVLFPLDDPKKMYETNKDNLSEYKNSAI